jgi:LysM repeat protein
MVANYMELGKSKSGVTAGTARSADELRDATLPSPGVASPHTRDDATQRASELGLGGRLNRLATATGASYETAAVQMLLKHCMNTESNPTGRMTTGDLAAGLKFIRTRPGTDLALDKGAQGELIRDVQHRLQRLGLLDVTPTGTLASKTESALASFKTRIPSLASQPDGVLTIDTLAYLLKETGWRPGSPSVNQAAPTARSMSSGAATSQGFDHKDLAAMEGQFRTKGYTLPGKEYPNAGVTISNGVDLGQWSKKDLLAIGVSPALVEKLGPYTKETLRGAAAEKYLKAHPLTISPTESKHLYEKVFGEILRKFAEQYEQNRAPNAPHFSALPDKLKTVVGSMAFNMGQNFTEVSGKDVYSKWRRTVGDQIFAGNYEKVFQMLVANPHSQEGLRNRRFKEAAIVLEYIASQDPEAAGTLVATTKLACSKAGKLTTFSAFKRVAEEFKPGLIAAIPATEMAKETVVADTQRNAKESPAKESEPQREKPLVHTVRKGDTLSELAKRYHCSVDELKQANRLKSDMISIGQKIRIPASQVAEQEQRGIKPLQRSVSYVSPFDHEPPRMLDT